MSTRKKEFNDREKQVSKKKKIKNNQYQFEGSPSKLERLRPYFNHPKVYKAAAVTTSLGLIGAGITFILLNPFAFSLIVGIATVVLAVAVITAVLAKTGYNFWTEKQKNKDNQPVKEPETRFSFK